MSRRHAAGNPTSPEMLQAIVKAGETYSIVASQDIVDVRGLKLWAKGQPVSAALQQRLLDRKLQRPLEACLAVEDGVALLACMPTCRPAWTTARRWPRRCVRGPRYCCNRSSNCRCIRWRSCCSPPPWRRDPTPCHMP